MREPDVFNAMVPVPAPLQATLGKTVRWAAWRIPAPAQLARPEQAATLAQWLVHCPGGHPFWSCWVMTVIHLRDIEGAAPAHKEYPEAMYEISFRAIDPRKLGSTGCPEPEIASIAEHGMLEPADFVAQFHGINDATACAILDAAAKYAALRVVSPDQINRHAWAELLVRTIAHFQSGIHKEVMPS